MVFKEASCLSYTTAKGKQDLSHRIPQLKSYKKNKGTDIKFHSEKMKWGSSKRNIIKNSDMFYFMAFWLLLLKWQEKTSYFSYKQVNQVEFKHITMLSTLSNFDTRGSAASHDWCVTVPKIREISDFGGHFSQKKLKPWLFRKVTEAMSEKS